MTSSSSSARQAFCCCFSHLRQSSRLPILAERRGYYSLGRCSCSCFILFYCNLSANNRSHFLPSIEPSLRNSRVVDQLPLSMIQPLVEIARVNFGCRYKFSTSAHFSSGPLPYVLPSWVVFDQEIVLADINVDFLVFYVEEADSLEFILAEQSFVSNFVLLPNSPALLTSIFEFPLVLRGRTPPVVEIIREFSPKKRLPIIAVLDTKALSFAISHRPLEHLFPLFGVDLYESSEQFRVVYLLLGANSKLESIFFFSNAQIIVIDLGHCTSFEEITEGSQNFRNIFHHQIFLFIDGAVMYWRLGLSHFYGQAINKPQIVQKISLLWHFNPQLIELNNNFTSPLILNLVIHFLFQSMLHHSQKDVNDEIKEEFLPRPDKYKDLINSKQIPTTNESLIVIPCLTKTYGFKTNQYKLNEKILKGVISEAEFNGFLRRANSIIDSELISKSTKENEPFFKIISTLLKISIMLSALALMLLAVMVYSTLEQVVQTIVFDTSVVLLGLSGLIACLCPISLYRQKYTSLNYEKIIGERLRQLESQENKLNASRKANHIIWRIQKNFYWVELHINRIMLEKGISIEMEA